MTTTVVVRANHGWPVDVTRVKPGWREDPSSTTRVQPNTEQAFAVWDGQDLLIHEVQPSEINETPASS